MFCGRARGKVKNTREKRRFVKQDQAHIITPKIKNERSMFRGHRETSNQAPRIRLSLFAAIL
jgi:hypothetical protein